METQPLTDRLRKPLWAQLGLIGLVFALGACGQTATPSTSTTPVPSVRRITPTPPPSATPYRTPTNLPPSSADRPTPLPLPTETSRFFAGSGVCSSCHRDQSDSSGQDVSIDRQWAVSSMANSARDPFWQAALSAEIAESPEQSEGIQSFCSTCHMPMAKYTANVFSTPAKVMGGGFINPENPLNGLAMDGVSCSLCHQIGQNGLGTEDSYSGGFVIDAEAPPGSRPAFGPYQTDSDLADVMARQSGFVPIKSDHIGQSELCATCHEVVLQLDGTASEASPLTLQATYLEWLQSDARYAQSCQTCHMPEVKSGAYVALQSRQPRSPFRQHTFLGGNVALLDIFARFGSDLGVGYLQDDIPAAQAAQRDFMQAQTAEASVVSVRQVGARLEITVDVSVKTGHKFPTGFPSRRAWIHLTVKDAAGSTVFESGSVAQDGTIMGDDKAQGSGSFEPHYRIIDSPEKVQIYEAVLGSPAGNATTRLTQAARWLKDNRLLPEGYDAGASDDATAVIGRAAEDGDFDGGGDVVQYKAPLAGTQGPYTVTVELLYQSVSPAWIQTLKDVPSVESERYVGYLADLPPETLLISRSEKISP
jgi:hypothetical protein